MSCSTGPQSNLRCLANSQAGWQHQATPRSSRTTSFSSSEVKVELRSPYQENTWKFWGFPLLKLDICGQHFKEEKLSLQIDLQNIQKTWLQVLVLRPLRQIWGEKDPKTLVCFTKLSSIIDLQQLRALVLSRKFRYTPCQFSSWITGMYTLQNTHLHARYFYPFYHLVTGVPIRQGRLMDFYILVVLHTLFYHNLFDRVVFSTESLHFTSRRGDCSIH